MNTTKYKGQVTVPVAIVFTIVTTTVAVISSWYAAQASTSEQIYNLKTTDAVHDEKLSEMRNDMTYLRKGVDALLWANHINPNTLK